MPRTRGGPAAIPNRIEDTKQCPHCRAWIISPHGRRELEAHIRAEHGKQQRAVYNWAIECNTCRTIGTDITASDSADDDSEPMCGSCGSYDVAATPAPIFDAIDHRQRTAPAPETVKRATLFDGVQDTHQTETELNGWRPTQGALL